MFDGRRLLTIETEFSHNTSARLRAAGRGRADDAERVTLIAHATPAVLGGNINSLPHRPLHLEAGDPDGGCDTQLREEAVKEMRTKAEAGDVDAIHEMGLSYHIGDVGIAKDHEQATGWFRRGHDLGDPMCTASLAYRYKFGMGVEQEEAYAVHLLTAAACRGSARACYELARIFNDGDCGLRPNPREATRWYRAMESTEVDDFIGYRLP